MDTTEQPPTVISFCSGYGGIELGLERVLGEVTVLAHVEIEAFAIANLVAKMEAGLMVPAPVWTDVKTFPADPFRGRVDILTGGYPCQPFSAAGKRQGADDPRHLWPFIRESVRAIRPRYCFFENVEGHISLGLSTVISDLEEDGYRTTWGIFSASEVGAPHQRKRVFILAHDRSVHSEGANPNGDDRDRVRELPRRQEIRSEAGRCCTGVGREELAHGKHDGLHNPYEKFNEDGPEGKMGEEYEHGETFGDGELPQLGYREHDGLHGLPDTGRGGQASDRSKRSTFRIPRQNQWQEGIAEEFNHCCCGDIWPSRPGEPQYEWEPPRTVGDDQSRGRGKSRNKAEEGKGCRTTRANGRNGGETTLESTLGRNFDGASHRLDHAELYQSCDNRTDELRLLGNGVVPATAARAFIILLRRLS